MSSNLKYNESEDRGILKILSTYPICDSINCSTFFIFYFYFTPK